jgi:integrase
MRHLPDQSVRPALSLSPHARPCLGAVWGKKIASPRQKRLPDALSDDQVRLLLGGIRNPVHKTCLAVVYACGLRISEATTLEIRRH